MGKTRFYNRFVTYGLEAAVGREQHENRAADLRTGFDLCENIPKIARRSDMIQTFVGASFPRRELRPILFDPAQ
jgi:hypothetical protein